ncbi:MAG TPA: S-layer homology domain-containing protein, partial [Cyanophyceae cyanobacterium]
QPQTAEVTSPPVPIVSPSEPPASPVIKATPGRVLQTAPVVPVPVVEASPSPVSTASPTPAKSVNFSDVPADFWARSYITALAERNIVVGFKDNTFRPNQPVTRAEFAVLLAKAFEQKAVAKVPNYKDVPSNFWAAPAIQEATRSGFLQGYPKTVFQPNQHIPRVQTLVALTSGLGLAPSSTPNQGLNNFYQDAAKIPKYATQSVAAATQQGLVVNYPNLKLLNPNQKATRAEVTAMVYQALVQARKAEAIPSIYVVKP